MNSVDSVLMEQFSLDPFAEIEIFSGHYFEDGTQYMQDVINEATSAPATKQGILSKIWATIKKFFGWLAKQWARFTAWVRRIFTRKAKTADQCIMDIVGTDVKSAPKSADACSDAKKSSAASDVKLDVPSSDSDNKSAADPSAKVLSIPFNPKVTDKGVEPVDSITLAYKDLQAKIEGDQIIFYPNQIRQNLSRQQPGNAGSIPAQGETKAAWNAMINIFHMVENPEHLDELAAIVEMLNKKTWKDGIFDATMFSNRVNEFMKYYYSDHSVSNSIGLTMAGINHMNTVLTGINKGLEFYDDPTTIPAENQPLVSKSLNDIAGIAFRLQFGMNMITGSMNSFHVIDARYAGVIDDNDKLAQFVANSIEANIPSKYIAYNVWAVCSPRMRGTAKQDKPAMGQSRLVIFPNGAKVVTKIALNQFGVRANNAESMVSDRFVKAGVGDIIAKIVNASNNKCVIDAEKATMVDNVSESTLNKTRSSMSEACAKAGLKINIADIHEDNVGYLHNQMVVIDYGFTER